MQHQFPANALTTEEVILGLAPDAGEEAKIGPAYLLRTAAQAALALGLCGAMNFVAG